MTGVDHQYSGTVEEAAQWLSQQDPPPRPIVPALRQRFDLTVPEACEAAALSERYRINWTAVG